MSPSSALCVVLGEEDTDMHGSCAHVHLDKVEPFETVLSLCIHGCPHVMDLELSQT